MISVVAWVFSALLICIVDVNYICYPLSSMRSLDGDVRVGCKPCTHDLDSQALYGRFVNVKSSDACGEGSGARLESETRSYHNGDPSNVSSLEAHW
jgi:hypothetical protein